MRPRNFFTWLVIFMLIHGSAACAHYRAGQPGNGEPSGIISPEASKTPFQPVPSTPTPYEPAEEPTTSPPPTPLVPTIAPKEQPLYIFHGIDFSNFRQQVTIQITPSSRSINSGRPFSISFTPGHTCVFGDHHGCVISFRNKVGQVNIFVSIHSGVGGEAQQLRHILEGTGVDQAGLSLKQTQLNIKALEGSSVKITQGALVVDGLIMAHMGRVPGARIASYFRVPYEQALETAAVFDTRLLPAAQSSQPALVIETCGWKSHEEPWSSGMTSTTASVYLGVIQ